MDIEKIFQFTHMLSEFREIKRMNKYHTSEVYENDSEHSYQLTLLCRYLISQHPELEYDIDKIIKYALIHDIVEVYAGDTLAFDNRDTFHKHNHTNNITRQNKKQREADSLHRLESEFPEAEDIRMRIHDYNQQGDREARFVYAMDKLIPDLTIIPGKGVVWKDINVSMQEVLNLKDKALIDPLATLLHKEITTIIKKNPERFTKEEISM